MAQGFTPGLVSKRVHRVRRMRELPIPGKLLVEVGAQVTADSIVAEANLPGDLHIVRVAEQLGIEPHEVLRGLRVAAGQIVKTGDLLCEHSGLFGLIRTRCVSPEPGMLEFISEASGHLGIRGAAKPVSLNAYMAGEIVEANQGKSVTVESRGVFIQGIFGIGGERHGFITCLPKQSGEISVADLPINLQGAVLVIRGAASQAVVETAASRGAQALICGSIDDSVLAAYLGFDLGIALTGDEAVPMVIIITEGFGRLEMAEHNYKLLSDFRDYAASVNGTTQVRAGAIRPEIIIPHEHGKGEETAATSQELRLGLKVRMIRVPFFGLYGNIEEMPTRPEKVPSGALTRVLRVRLEQGELITVPRANVEIAAI